MFERFTGRARQVIFLAVDEAKARNQYAIGPEHILLGLIHEGEGLAAQALLASGVSLDAAREAVAELREAGLPPRPNGPISFTPFGKEVLEKSLRQALQLGSNHIGAEHLLLGVLSESQRHILRELWRKLGVDPEQVRQELLRRIEQAGTDSTEAAAKS